jgi:hypothetical protein
MRVLRPYLIPTLAGWLGLMFAGGAAARTVSLDGDWNFVADSASSMDVGRLASAPYIRPTRVPSSWQTQFADLRDYAGAAWYWRSVSLEPPPPDQVVLLRFGAVDYRAEVYVNGQKAGSHEGGYLPFEFDITSQVRSGENQIAVRVVDPGVKPAEVVEGIAYAEIPHGKQDWYVQTSGLWQGVELDVRPRVRLGAVHISAKVDGSFRIEAPVINSPRTATAAPPSVRVQLFDSFHKLVWEGTEGLKAGQARGEFSGRLSASPSLWSPSSPMLYSAEVLLSSGDSEEYHFGFRSFETREGKFFLNGQVTYLRGALDQDFYSETAYTSPSLEFLKEEMQKAKALGLNLLRCHIKVPDPRYLQAADEVGMLVWYEIPNWDKLTENSRRRGLETLRGMAERDWNHPCIVVASLINESWGINLKESADRVWLKQAYQEAKTIVPGWLVEDNSPCCDNFHLVTDVADFHEYSAIPDYAANFDRLVEDLASRPGWLFSPYGDAAPRGDEPLLLSEFGNWGLPRHTDPEPWWFARDFHGDKTTLPAGVDKRFIDYHYNSLFADLDALVDATQWHEYHSLKYEIESLRIHPTLQGYVITEFTDINWESNGLLDMWRRPKVFAEPLAQLQQDDLVAVRAEKWNFSAGEKVQAEVYFSHYSTALLTGARVSWRVEGTALEGNFTLPVVPSGSVAKLGQIEFTVPAIRAPSKNLLKLQVASGGKTISENSLELFFYPPRVQELPPPVSFYDPGGRLRRLVNEMHARNYLPPSGSESFPVFITSVFDDQAKKTLRAGGRVILMATDRMTLAPGLEVVPRAGSHLDGNWISGFSWLRKNQEPFKSVGFDTLAGFETQAVTPGAVVEGVPPENFSDVLAGVFYGWIQSNVGTLVQAKAGKGKLFICTFSLATTYASDPYATYFLDALVNYAAVGPTPGFQIPL